MASKKQWAYILGFAVVAALLNSAPTAAESLGYGFGVLLLAYIAVALYNADPSAALARVKAWRN